MINKNLTPSLSIRILLFPTLFLAWIGTYNSDRPERIVAKVMVVGYEKRFGSKYTKFLATSVFIALNPDVKSLM
jgi:hypothetical protein